MKKELLFTLLGVLMALTALARDFSYEYEGQTLTYTVIDEDAKTVMTAKGYEFPVPGYNPSPGNNVSGNVIIPEIVKYGDVEYTVTTIGELAFYDCYRLTSVTIPNSVTSIRNRAFDDCSGLEKAEFGSIEQICGIKFGSDSANPLYYAHNLYINGEEIKDLVIPESVESIGYNAFCYCSSLTSVTIPNSVTSIGNYAFDGCSGLTSVTIPNSVTSIGSGTFRGCSSLRSVNVLAEKPASMEFDSFEGLYNNTVLIIPDQSASEYLCTNWSLFDNLRQSESGNSITSYTDGVLKYRLSPAANSDEINQAVIISGNYSGEIYVPERFACESESGEMIYYVTGIGYNAFAYSNINKIEFNSMIDLKNIGDNAFYNSQNLTEISIPKTVESIGNYAFHSCSGLTSVTIPNSVNGTFYGCTSLTSVIIPNSVTSIGSSAFYKCSGLTSVTIGNSVKSIGDYAFYDYNGLKKAEFGSIEQLCSIKFGNISANPLYRTHNFDINGNLYINGEEIKDLVIPESVNSIGDYAFSGCSGLTSVTIGNSVKSIGKSAFYNCSRLTSVIIPNSVTSIGYGAFSGCSGLTSVTLGNSVKSIGNNTFYGCKFRQITIPASVEYIGSEAIPANEVIISDSTNPIELDNNSFYKNLTSLYWGRTLDNFNIPILLLLQLQTLEIGNIAEEIPAGLFSGCSTITSLSLGSSLTTIGDEAFNGCTGLNEVVISPAVETIGASSFAGCSGLSTIIMGSNVKTIGEKAFDGCPAEIVCITAQTPPTAPNNTFSTYSGKLYLQGEYAIDAYYDAFTCWDRFDSYQMIEPETIEVSKNNVAGRPGQTIQLAASLKPDNVTLPQIFWYSTNPEIATVDNKGLVTFVGYNTMTTRASECRIIATSLYADGPVAEISVTSDVIMVSSLTFDEDNYIVEVGGTFDLNDEVEILPADATNKTLTWKSSDESVATVRNGVVTVLVEKPCEITATTTDGSELSVVCTINASSGVATIAADELYDVYSMSGILVKRNIKLGEVTSLIPGIYIVRQGNAVRKISVK